jgi:hypothetical protein
MISLNKKDFPKWKTVYAKVDPITGVKFWTDVKHTIYFESKNRKKAHYHNKVLKINEERAKLMEAEQKKEQEEKDFRKKQDELRKSGNAWGMFAASLNESMRLNKLRLEERKKLRNI